MDKKKPRATYKGLLTQPIELGELLENCENQLLFPDPELRAKYRKMRDDYVEDQVNFRITLLKHHFGLEKDAPLQELVWELACAHVPNFGFREPQRRGRPREWTLDKQKRLVEAVDAATPASGVTAAFNTIAQTDEWQPKRGYPLGKKERSAAIKRRADSLKAVNYRAVGNTRNRRMQ